MISILIITKNESQVLGGCIASVSWSDDIHVYDSFSDDDTAAVATALRAKVTQRVFDGYATQRNSALHSLSFAYPWVLILDADERVPDALADEIKAFVAADKEDIAACRMRRRDFFMGRHLAHAQISPYYVRLVRPKLVHYEREVNEVLVVDGAIKELTQPFDHYPFSKGIHRWFEKHNTYSTMEARQVILANQQKTVFSFQMMLFCSDFNQRRAHQKEFFNKLPGRPLLKFFYMFLFRRSFMDGAPGVTYALLQTIYEYMIVIKVKELEAQVDGAYPTTVTLGQVSGVELEQNTAPTN